MLMIQKKSVQKFDILPLGFRLSSQNNFLHAGKLCRHAIFISLNRKTDYSEDFRLYET